jgi:D-Tyr-tRNAtyr deacylase
VIAVVQRVARASVTANGREVSHIGPGALVLLGVARGDTREGAVRLAGRIHALRARGVTVAAGCFGAHMRVALENDGPVTLIVDDRGS